MKKVVVVAAVAGVAGVAAAVSAEGEKKESSCGDAGGGEDKEAPFGEGDDDDMVDRSPSFQESNPRNNCCFCGNPDLLAIPEFGRPLPASWQII